MKRPAAVAGRGLAESASRGAVVTLGGQAVRVVVQLAGIVVLARLLGPADYGLVAMVTVIIGVGEVFRDFGLSAAAIQAKTLTPEQKDNLFWINTGIGLLLTLLVIAAAGPIATFYGDERLRPLTMALSVTFLLNGLATQFRADLGRNLGFLRLTVVDVVGQAVALGVAIWLAATGAGYWALVAQQVAQPLIVLIMLVIATGWLPHGMHRGARMGPFLTYGSSVFGAQLLGYVSRNVDSFIIGARFGAAQLGLYNKGFQLMMMPLLQLQAPSTRVALPVLSRLQDNRERFNSFISFGQSALLTLIGGVFALLGSQASAVVEVLLGPAWLGVVPIFQILLVAGYFQAAGYAQYWIFLAKGLTRSNLYFALVTRPVMVGIIALGSIWGVYGVAVGYTVSVGLAWPIGLIWIGRVADVDTRRLLHNGIRTIVVFGAATLVSYASTLSMADQPPVLRLVVGAAALAGALLLEMAVWPRFRADVVAFIGARRFLYRTRGAGNADGPPTGDVVKESI